MFGIGFPEMILILALALIVVGPDKLPELARSVAKTIMDLKKTAEGLKDNLNLEDNPLNEIKPQLEDAAQNFKETILDAETHTVHENSMQPTVKLDPLKESLKVPPEQDKEKEVSSQTDPYENLQKGTEKRPMKDRPSNTTDPAPEEE